MGDIAQQLLLATDQVLNLLGHAIKLLRQLADLITATAEHRRYQRSEGNGYTTLDQRNPAYASMVYAMDENVGRLIDRLKETGRYANTIIIFTSDNGGLSTLAARRRGTAPTSVLPLRAGKGWLYEGGIRVPLLIKPAGFEGSRLMRTSPVVGHDLFPTLLSMTGINVPDKEIDGTDLSPLLVPNGSLPERDLYWHYPHYHGSAWTPGAAIRDGNRKLIEFHETGTVELYDLSSDPGETNNLATKNPDQAKALLAKLHTWQKTLNAKLPTKR